MYEESQPPIHDVFEDQTMKDNGTAKIRKLAKNPKNPYQSGQRIFIGGLSKFYLYPD